MNGLDVCNEGNIAMMRVDNTLMQCGLNHSYPVVSVHQQVRAYVHEG